MNNSAERYEHGYALMIGIGYGHWESSLSGPIRDVLALKDHFLDIKKAAYKPENIICLTEKEATKNGIIDALKEIADKSKNDIDASVIIYYSGHGATSNGKYFLVPYDFDLASFHTNNNSLLESAIYSDQFAEAISAVDARKCMVILDCCHAENIPVLKEISNKFLTGFIDNVSENISTTQEKSGFNEKIKKGEGRVILTSCKASETSLDLGQISLFTKVLLESLNGTSNIESDGWVRLIDLIRYIPLTVSSIAKNKFNHNQNPIFKRIENLGAEEFIICAYDINKAKSINANSSQFSEHAYDYVEDATQKINDGSIPEAFIILDKNITNDFQYNRFKREFSAGLKGIDLVDFTDRLMVYINKERKH
jgi:hypothetical protein